jgi:hypothetical protein
MMRITENKGIAALEVSLPKFPVSDDTGASRACSLALACSRSLGNACILLLLCNGRSSSHECAADLAFTQ